ncbi:MAG: (d)CMP kinase [Simkaniaceae bacterium]|nr:(d)CMP kinase [Simkaniaceae bacterium]
MIITIDGPAGTGKSTVSKAVAQKLGFTYFNTGALYRALAYETDRTKKDPVEVARDFPFRIEGDRYFIRDQDVTEVIRSPEVTRLSSLYSAIPAVREGILHFQKTFALQGNTVFEGRDLGTVVFPSAEVKIFLTATPEKRAERRFKESKGVTFEEVLEDLKERDFADTHRKVAPLKQAVDAHLIDTTNLTVNEVVDQIIMFVK